MQGPSIVGSEANYPTVIRHRPTGEPQKKSPYGMGSPVEPEVPEHLLWRGFESSFTPTQIETSLLERYTGETPCGESALPTHLDQTPSTQPLARAGRPSTSVEGESYASGVGSNHAKSEGL